jgi:hypothetical protein
MRIHETEITRLADVVVHALLTQGYIKSKVDEKQLIARVSRIIVDNLRAEEALELEAEQLAQKLSSKSLGMDQRKIVEGIKARLAKERGFTL